MGYDDDKLEHLVECMGGLVDTVSVEQLASAGVSNRTAFDLRRRLDTRSSLVEVCCGAIFDTTRLLLWGMGNSFTSIDRLT